MSRNLHDFRALYNSLRVGVWILMALDHIQKKNRVYRISERVIRAKSFLNDLFSSFFLARKKLEAGSSRDYKPQKLGTSSRPNCAIYQKSLDSQFLKGKQKSSVCG